MKWFYIVSTALVALLSLSPFILAPSTTTEQFKGKIVAYSSYGAKIRSLDPATCGDVSSSVIQGNFYEGLYGYDFLARPVKLVPLLAQAMPEISPDGLTYTIRVREDVKYRRNPCFGTDADGTPKTRTVTADDFVLAVKRIADYHVETPMSFAFIEDKVVGAKRYRDRTQTYARGDFDRYKEPLEGVRAIDEHTLQIKLNVPFPQLVYVLALTNYAPIPRELVDYYLASRDDGAGGRTPLPLEQREPLIHDFRAAVGTGAYYLSQFVDGGDIILERNEDCRDEYYPSEGSPGDAEGGLLADAGKKTPFIDTQYFMFISEDYTMWKLFLSKQIDSTGIPRQVYNQIIGPGKELADEWASQGVRLVKYSDPAVYWLAFNMEDRVLGASKSLRQAMCLCFNVEDYVDVLHNGRGIRAVNMIPSSFEAHDEAGPSQYARLDLAAASQKLQDARRELSAAGVLGADEEITLTLDLPGRDEEDRRTGEFIQKQFRQIGVKLKIELNDWPTLQSKVEKKQTQVYAMGWHADYPDPENFLQLYYGPNIKRGTNNSNYSNPLFDRLFERAAIMPPSPRRTELYVQMIRILNEDCPVLLLSEPISFVLFHDWVRNVKPHPIGYGMSKYRRLDVSRRQAQGGR